MTDEQRAAHLRLVSSLRGRITTHTWMPLVKIQQGHKRTPAEEQVLKEKLLEMRSKGCTRKQMKAECGCTNKTIVKLIGRLT